jgi:hypothetical protein
MTPSRSSQQIYDQLLDINKDAFEQGLYEVAYHTLAAALHCATQIRGQAPLIALEQRARQQKDWIDASAPEHPVSSQSASLHGHRSIYTSLLMQIQTKERVQRHPPPHQSFPET